MIYCGGRENGAGKKLKEAGNSHWQDSNGENLFNFTALPGGSRIDGSFEGLKNTAAWWSPGYGTESNMAYYYINNAEDNTFYNGSWVGNGHSVRCIRE